METVVSLLPKALALFGGLVAVYWGFTKVVGPVASKGLSLFTVLKSDFAALEARVAGVERSVGIVPPGTTAVAKAAPKAATTAAATVAAPAAAVGVATPLTVTPVVAPAPSTSQVAG
jgi:hypothetical protein